MSKTDMIIIHDALCFVMKPEVEEAFDKFIKRNMRKNPEVCDEWNSGKKAGGGHELIGRIVDIISDLGESE